MNRRQLLQRLGASALALTAVAVTKLSFGATRNNGLRQAQRVARDWATRHTIYRPDTGQAFVSPSAGRTADYIEVGSTHSDKPFGANVNRQPLTWVEN